MSLNSQYVIAPSLEMYFVDKNTGLPLSGGKVYFYKDTQRNILKDVFEISGTAPNYSYTVLPNPVTLSSVGTFQDGSNNNVIPYYFPYDSSGSLELYYIEVYNSAGVLQFTRQGWPNLADDSTATNSNVINFIPNGQFLTHTNVPASSANTFIPGKISAAVTNIAQGGWTFETNATGNTDILTFPIYSSPQNPPSTNPRYAVNLQTTVAGSGSTRDICVKFRNVNTFSSAVNSYNLYFEGESIGSSVTAELYIKKFFGTGGTPTADQLIDVGPITLTNNVISSYNRSMPFGTNAGTSIGTNNDDYVQIIIRMPVNGVQQVQFTNFCLTNSTAVLSAFPQQTEAQQLAPSVAGWMPVPNPDGSDLYLPLMLTKSGMIFDYSLIGNVVAAGNLSNYSGSVCTNGNLLLADGTQYKYNDFSTLGIPYSRLGNFYLAGGTAGVPQFGTGLNFATTYIESGSTSNLYFTFNKVGTPTSPANGGVSPGFTYKPIIDGTTPFGFSSYSNGTTLVTSICNTVGVSFIASSAGTSGMTVSDIRNAAGTYYAFNVTALSAASLGNGAGTGKYFDFGNTTVGYRVWFKTATESAPAAGGNTLVQLDLDLVMTDADVAKVLASAISGLRSAQITCVAAASVAQSSFFTFTVNAQIYTVWYNKDGAGIEPIVANSIFIPVAILTADTSALVASKTQVEFNKVYFAVPNLKDLFLRGYSTDGTWDIDYLNRFSFANTLLGSSPGTFELDQFISHHHTGTGGIVSGNNAGGTPSGITFGANDQNSDLGLSRMTTPYGGGTETRPVNASVVWAIKY